MYYYSMDLTNDIRDRLSRISSSDNERIEGFWVDRDPYEHDQVAKILIVIKDESDGVNLCVQAGQALADLIPSSCVFIGQDYDCLPCDKEKFNKISNQLTFK